MAMKFRAHETFFIRKGWLSKGMKHVLRKPNVFVDKEENPMDALGIGSNMVKSLRYWLQAVGLTQEPRTGRRDQTLTPLGNVIYAHDRFIEEMGTLHLLHYKLATNKEDATAWYFFFNKFIATEFTREDFINSLQSYILMSGESISVASRSLSEDFACIINTYVPRYKTNPDKVSPENNIDCPLGEIGLIDILAKKTFKKSIPAANTFDPWIVLAIISDRANGRNQIGLNELLTAEGNIGRIFNLDSITMIEVLRRVEKLGALKIIRTAGLDVVHLLKDYTFLDCVENYYASL
jgi:hypothetical protein